MIGPSSGRIEWVIIMEQDARRTPLLDGFITSLDALQQDWRGAFADQRQEAIWNRASTAAMYLMMWASLVAALVLDALDSARYSTCTLLLCLIPMGGSVFARTVALRQGFTPVYRVPSWPSTVLSGALFWIIFFVLTRAMEPDGDWRGRVVASTVVAVFWTVVMRVVLHYRQRAAADRDVRTPDGR